jgi:uncharacterized glyoxalase superfamily protein PhnB
MAEILPIIHCKAVEPALAFYRDSLGFSEYFTMTDDDGTVVYAGLTFENATLMIAKSAEGRVDGGEGVILYVYMDGDIDHYFERRVRKSAAIQMLHEPIDQPWYDRTFGIKDPWGYEIHFAKALPQPQV